MSKREQRRREGEILDEASDATFPQSFKVGLGKLEIGEVIDSCIL